MGYLGPGIANQGWGVAKRQVASQSSSTQKSGIDLAAQGVGRGLYDNAIGVLNKDRLNITQKNSDRLRNYNYAMGQAGNQLEGQGEASRNRIYRDFGNERNSVGSQLAGTGLYNSTVSANLRQGVDRNQAEALGGLDEKLRDQLTALLSQKAQGASEIEGDSSQLMTQLANILAGLGGEKAAYSPNKSSSTSSSTSYQGGF